MNKDSYYFSHDYNARNDFKCLFLRQQLGMEGYGIYWFIVESLAESGGFLPLKIIPVLAMQMQTSEIKVSAVINEYDLFQVHENQFFSVRLNKHLETRKSLSDAGKKGAENRWVNRVAIGDGISTPNAKERKEKKERKESKVLYPTLDLIKEYFKQNGYSEESAIKAFNYYSVADWKDSNGNQVKNWKQKMHSVWFKDENKHIEKKDEIPFFAKFTR
jgi:NADH:ubiquinone oxidoreductase subunit E